MHRDLRRSLVWTLLALPGCADAVLPPSPDAAVVATPDATAPAPDVEPQDIAADQPAPSPCGPCDDDNACTKDKCDDASATCQHVAVAAVCDDGDACTAADACKQGQCSGVPKTCSDGDPCTVDVCKAGVGCAHESKCPVGTTCHPVTLQCVDGSTFTCSMTDGWGWTGQFVNKLQLPKPDGGCDLDDDGKPNNVLGKVVDLYPQLNVSLAAVSQAGGPTFLLRAKAFQTDGSTFSLEILRAHAVAGEEPCATPTCKATVDVASFSPAVKACTAVSTLDATATAASLSAVAATIAEPLPFPLFADVELPLQVLRVAASTPEGPLWSGTAAGKICGFIPVTALQALTPAPGGGSPLLTGVLKPDVDSNGDGSKDGVSFALDFEAVPAVVVGLTPGQ